MGRCWWRSKHGWVNCRGVCCSSWIFWNFLGGCCSRSSFGKSCWTDLPWFLCSPSWGRSLVWTRGKHIQDCERQCKGHGEALCDDEGSGNCPIGYVERRSYKPCFSDEQDEAHAHPWSR